MTLKDFEKHIGGKILDRGYNYFSNDRVDSLEKVAPGLWLALVHGSETYTVQVRTNRTKISGWDCDCPYDFGPVCKHVVAVLYAMDEKMEIKKEKPSTPKKKKPSKKNRVQDIFKKTSKKELQEFIIEQFKKDAGIKNAFVACFAEYLDENPDQKYTTMVRNIYKSAQGRHGFIDYKSASSLTQPLFNLAEKADALREGNNIRESLSICKALVEEVPFFLQNMDDSDGGAGDLFYYAFTTLGEIALQAPPLMKEELFSYCIEEFGKQKYHGVGFEDHFLHLFPELITTREQEVQFFELIERQIQVEKQKTYPDYAVARLLKSKIEYLLKAEREGEAFVIIEKHNNYPDFRKMLVDKALSDTDFEFAKKLCHEGIDIANEQHHVGTVNSWRQKLIDIAKIEQDVPEIRKWAEHLFFDNHFNLHYYKELKATYDENNWPEKCEELITRIKSKNRLGNYGNADSLAQIFAEEKYDDRLLKLLQLNPKSLYLVDGYADHLKNEYPEEILDLYEEGVKEHATQAGRKIYREVASLLKKMRKIEGGEEKIATIIQFFRTHYNNRPAMMEILNKNFPQR